MSNRDLDLYKREEIGKSYGIQNSTKLVYLLQEIERLRDELNKIVIHDPKKINSMETLELSQKLDELIIRYIWIKGS